MIGFGQIINGFDYTIINEKVQKLNCLPPSQLFPTPSSVLIQDGNVGLTYDGTFLWHTSTIGSSTTLNKIDLFGNPINNFNIQAYGPGGLCFDGVNFWKVVEQTGRLYKIDNNGVILETFLLPSNGCNEPNGWGIAWDGNYLWHSEYSYPSCNITFPQGDSTKFYKIDPNNGQVIHSFTLPYWICAIEYVNGDLHALKSATTSHLNSDGLSKKYIIDINTESYIDSVEWCMEYPLGLTSAGIDFWSLEHDTISFPSVSIAGLYKFSTTSTNIKETDKSQINLIKTIDLLGRETKQTNQPLFYIYDDGTVEKRIFVE